MMMTRRTMVWGTAAAVLTLGLGAVALPDMVRAAPSPAPAGAAAVEVWKSAGCECCDGWVRHMRAAGFDVTVHTVDDMTPVRRAAGVPEELESCHTARVGGYVVEGHVPAADVRRLLAERPAARGLSVPGMPQSAPGMDNPGEPYEVVLFGRSEPTVYARH